MPGDSSDQKRKRRSPTVVDEAGGATLRVTIPRAIWETATAFALQNDLKPEQALKILINHFATMIAQGETEFLGMTLRSAAQQARNANFGVLDDQPKIDLSKLHRSKKTKSGYVGVYANGSGFRAMGRESKESTKQIYLGQFETSEAAAWRRYLHYKTNKLPYGELELEIERFRTTFNDQRTDEEIIADIKDEATRFGYYHEMFPNEPVPEDHGKHLKMPGA